MSFTQFGAIKYSFAFAVAGSTAAIAAIAAAAIEAATGIAPQELVISGEPEFVAEADGPDGTIEAVAVGQMKYAFTLSGYITDVDKFNEEGLSFEYDGRFYIITGNQDTKSNKQFQKGQLSGVCYKNIEGEAVAGP